MGDLTKLFKRDLPQKSVSDYSFKEEFNFLKHKYLDLNRELVLAKEAGMLIIKQSGIQHG